MRSLLGVVIQVVGFLFHQFKYVLPVPSDLESSLKDQLLSLWGSLCVLFVGFPLLLLIFALCVWSLLVWLICVLGCFTLGFSYFGLSGFPILDFGGYFLPHFREALNYYLLKYILMPFLFVFFCNTYDLNAGSFNIVPEASEIVLVF